MKLHALVCNAGALLNDFTKTKEGLLLLLLLFILIHYYYHHHYHHHHYYYHYYFHSPLCLILFLTPSLSPPPPTLSPGVETTFACHLLFGTYLLTKLALPTLKKTPDSRVVVVSSGGMYNTAFPDWDIMTCRFVYIISIYIYIYLYDI